MDAKIEILHALQAMTSELGRIPKRQEFTAIHFTRDYIEKHWGAWTTLLQAAGLHSPGKRIIIDEQPNLSRAPRIMHLDIETSPIISYTWGRWDQNISMNQVVQDWFIMAFCADIDGVIHYRDQRDSDPLNNDLDLCKKLHELLSSVEIVYGWNLNKFDLKKINARFFFHKLPPITTYRSIDGLLVLRNKMSLTSNKLDDVAKLLGLEGKLKSNEFPGQELWNECLKRNPAAWDSMRAYNVQDVKILKDVMEFVDPWHSKINFGVFEHGSKCSCGSMEFTLLELPIVTNSGKFAAYRCDDCSRVLKDKTNLLHPETRKSLLT